MVFFFPGKNKFLPTFLSKSNLKFEDFVLLLLIHPLTYRLKSFYEEGEREMMREQIGVLQNKVKQLLKFPMFLFQCLWPTYFHVL